MVLVTGRVQVAAEHCERFLAIATEMCSTSRTEDGCRGYRFYADLERPEHYVIVEEWEDEEALQAHFAQPHTTRFLTDLTAILAAPPDALFHTVAASRRLDPTRGLLPLD